MREELLLLSCKLRLDHRVIDSVLMPIPTATTIGKIQVIHKQHNVVEVETGFAIHHRRVRARMAAVPSRKMTAGPCVLQPVCGIGSLVSLSAWLGGDAGD